MTIFGNRRPPEAPRYDNPQTVTPVRRQPIGFDTVLGTNCEVEGTLRVTANVRLDGKFKGTLDITGNVLVGETGNIEADIHAKNVSIAGAVRGNISGKKVQILRTGRIWGDISATALSTEEGAFIDGKIIMVSHSAAHEEPDDIEDAKADDPDKTKTEPTGAADSDNENTS